ncbi:ribonuclease H-like domain-containing protein [Tanacetum coccineum]
MTSSLKLSIVVEIFIDLEVVVIGSSKLNVSISRLFHHECPTILIKLLKTIKAFCSNDWHLLMDIVKTSIDVHKMPDNKCFLLHSITSFVPFLQQIIIVNIAVIIFSSALYHEAILIFAEQLVCKLKKSLYGLKQAPRQWNAKLTQTLVECGFKQSNSDYSLFSKSEKGNFLALLVYVDDIIVTKNNVDEIEKFKEFLRTKFQIKYLGKLKYFLGIEVLETDLGICLSQRKYCLDLLSEYGLLACKSSTTPLEQNLAISNEPTEIDKVLDNITKYQRFIRKLIYLTHTRPDISYSVHCLSQFMHKPLRSHIKIDLKVLRYLKSNPGKCIHIVREPKASLEAFVDVDWAKCLATRKSVTAEYKAMAFVTSEVTWILKILRDLEWDKVLPANLYCDNQAAIKIMIIGLSELEASSLETLDQTFDRLQKLIGQLEIQGEVIGQEDMNLKLLRSLPSEWKTHALIWRNKAEIETISLDDFTNNTIEIDNNANRVSAAHTQGNTVNSTSVDNLSDAVICAFLASQPNSPQLAREDLEQIDPDDLEEMDLH